MKTVLFLAVAAASLVGCQHWRNSGNTVLTEKSSDNLRVATYNVHYIAMRQDTGPWSRGDWERRKIPLDLAFKAAGSDLIAFQEMESFSRGDMSADKLTLDWLLARNPQYRAGAIGDPSVFPSTQPILYRVDRLDLLEQGWFFFSATPDVIYSRTFNGSFPAFALWARFKDRRNGQNFRVINLHTDFRSRSNRLQSVELVAERIAPWIKQGETIMLAGDLNAWRGAATFDILEAVGLSFVPITGSTYHFNRGLNLFGAIDHIGYSNGIKLVSKPAVLREKFGGEWPTDHYPVVVDFKFQP